MSDSRGRRARLKVLDTRSRRRRRMPALEGLEPRIALSASAYTVNATTDTGSGSTGDLRYVINQANADPNAAGSVIQFDPTVFSTPQTITLSSTLTLSESAGPEEIDAPAAGVTISGGGTVRVFSVASGVTATLSGLTITGGSAFKYGGGVYNDGGAMTVVGCTIAGNYAGFNGGGLANEVGTATVTNSTIESNRAYRSGGGLLNDHGGTVTVTGGVIEGNTAGLVGGGIHNTSLMTLSGVTISGNTSAAGGGGVSDQNSGSTASMVECTVSGNSALGNASPNPYYSTGGNGGGILVNGELTVESSTVAGNSAGGNGGGVFLGGGTLSLSDCTIASNRARNGVGGGIGDQSGTATLTNTIVAGNTDGSGDSDIAGAAGSGVTGTYNLIGTGGSGGITNGSGSNIVLSDLSTLGLAPLGNYGGPTQTMALLPGSAAIGAGTGIGGISTDQRGATRATSGATDIGAFEDQGYTLAVGSGSGQYAPTSHAFASPLVAALTEDFAGSPLQGATIDFSAPGTGAGATLGAASAVTDASGRASVTATANATAGSYAVTASAAGVASTPSFDLTNRIPVSLTGARIYDGTTTADSTILTISNVVLGDDVTLSGSAGLAAKDAGPETITDFSGLTLGGTDAANYTLTDATGSVTVSPLAVTLTGSRAYDGSATAGGALLTASNEVSGDDLTFSGGAGLAGKDQGSQVITDFSGLTPGGTDAGDYTLTGATGSVTVSPLAVTLTGTRTYDGTTTADFSILTVSNAVGGDAVDVASGTATLAAKDAGPETITDLSGLTLGNNGAGDYTLVGASGTVTVTPASLTISAVTDSKVYCGTTTSTATPIVTGTLYGSDSVTGLSQAFASKDVMGPGGSTLVVAGYTVNDGNGGGNYDVTTQTASGTVTKANATIDITPVGVTYDGNAHTATGTATGVGGDGALSGLDVSQTAHTNPGSYTDAWTFTDTTGNYNNASGTVSDTIAKAALTITLGSLVKTYGDALAVTGAGFTATGLVAGDTVTGVTLTGAGAGAAATAPVAGSPYAIVPSDAVGSGLGNYTISYHAGTLAVRPAPLTITADSAAMPFGGAVPPLTASYAGFVNGEGPASLIRPVQLTTSATSNSVAGTYSIIASGANSPNYAITYVPGSLTVAPPAPPAQPAARAAAGFITATYGEVLGRSPEPMGLRYWMHRSLRGASRQSIFRGIAGSRERRLLVHQGRAPAIPLPAAYSHALRSARTAARGPQVAPAGPLALPKAGHGHTLARPRGAGRA